MGAGPLLFVIAPGRTGRAPPPETRTGRASQAGARGLSAFWGPRGPSPPPPARPPRREVAHPRALPGRGPRGADRPRDCRDRLATPGPPRTSPVLPTSIIPLAPRRRKPRRRRCRAGRGWSTRPCSRPKDFSRPDPKSFGARARSSEAIKHTGWRGPPAPRAARAPGPTAELCASRGGAEARPRRARRRV